MSLWIRESFIFEVHRETDRFLESSGVHLPQTNFHFRHTTTSFRDIFLSPVPRLFLFWCTKNFSDIFPFPLPWLSTIFIHVLSSSLCTLSKLHMLFTGDNWDPPSRFPDFSVHHSFSATFSPPFFDFFFPTGNKNKYHWETVYQTRTHALLP